MILGLNPERTEHVFYAPEGVEMSKTAIFWVITCFRVRTRVPRPTSYLVFFSRLFQTHSWRSRLSLTCGSLFDNRTFDDSVFADAGCSDQYDDWLVNVPPGHGWPGNDASDTDTAQSNDVGAKLIPQVRNSSVVDACDSWD